MSETTVELVSVETCGKCGGNYRQPITYDDGAVAQWIRCAYCVSGETRRSVTCKDCGWWEREIGQDSGFCRNPDTGLGLTCDTFGCIQWAPKVIVEPTADQRAGRGGE